MKIGVMYSGLKSANGADYVAQYLMNAVLMEGHDLVEVGRFGHKGVINEIKSIPDGLDVLIHSSGFSLAENPDVVDLFKQKTKVFMWTHNDELSYWNSRIIKVTQRVDKHFSYTKTHGYGSHVVYLPLAADQSVFHPLDCKRKYDVGIYGFPHDHRVKAMDRIKTMYPKILLSFGMYTGYDRVNLEINSCRMLVAPNQDCDSENLNAVVFGCPCRTFEAPCTGVFQLQVERGGLKDVYPHAPMVPHLTNPGEFDQAWGKAIQYWLDHEDERLDVAKVLFNQTMQEHLYVHRLRTMLSYL